MTAVPVPPRRPRITPRERYVRSGSEAQLYIAVTDALGWRGWRWMHIGRSDHALLNDAGAGWPDIVALRGRRLLVVELKSHSGSYEPGQIEWLDAFRAAGAETLTLRPEGLDAFLSEIA